MMFNDPGESEDEMTYEEAMARMKEDRCCEKDCGEFEARVTFRNKQRTRQPLQPVWIKGRRWLAVQLQKSGSALRHLSTPHCQNEEVGSRR